MTSRKLLLRALLCCTLSVLAANAAAQPAPSATVSVQGQVLSRQGPVPGVAVFLVHEVLGRSAPSYTDLYGRFGWSAIPVRPEPYFLEIYWGARLVTGSRSMSTAPSCCRPFVCSNR